MFKKTIAVTAMAVSLAMPAYADEITAIVQKDLTTLGYDPGNTDGEMTPATIVAISKFQAENGLEVTGEATPQLAGVIKARMNQPAQSAQPAQAAPVGNSAAANAQAAQQACLQRKIAEAQESQTRKRGLGSLMRAATRTASRFGGGSAAQDISRVSADIFAADATASDLQSAAKDLGITESDIEACRNPAS